MRLALIADIHGNLPALDAVLAEIGREGVDRIVCLGDISLGPQPVETLERVRSLGCPVIMGNWDAWLLDGMPQLDGQLGEVLGDLRSWSAEQLSSEQRHPLTEFHPTVEVALPDGATLLAFHGSPRSFEDLILATTPDEEVEEMLAGRTALVLAGGHTHFQLFRRFGESVLLNPGSIGLPFRRPRRGSWRSRGARNTASCSTRATGCRSSSGAPPSMSTACSGRCARAGCRTRSGGRLWTAESAPH